MPAFEDDLKAAREARQRTLADVQQETRIPLDVLKRFESGDLASDSTYNEVYLKAFIGSYAKAVGVPQAAAAAAFAASRAGTYHGELAPDYDPSTAPRTPSAPPPAEASASPPAVSRTAPVSAASDAPVAPQPAAPASPVAALASAPEAPRSTATPVIGERVSRQVVKGARRSYDKNWATIIGLTVVVVLGLAAAMYFLFRSDDVPDDGTTVVASGVAAQIDSAGVGAGAAAGGPQLQFPITVSVAARGDGLQSFRVSEDDGERTPYWINSGASRTFTADSSLTLWGEGSGTFFSDAVVELQGIRWTPPDGEAVVISRAAGQALLDSLAAAGTPAPVPAP